MKLNYNQKSVINLSLIALIMLSFYPPWQYSVIYSIEQVNPDIIDGGYHFVFSNPEFDDLDAYIIEQGIDYKKFIFHMGQLLLISGLFFGGFSGKFFHNSNKVKQNNEDVFLDENEGKEEAKSSTDMVGVVGLFLMIAGGIGAIYLTKVLLDINYRNVSVGFFIGYYFIPFAIMIIGYFMTGYEK